VEASRRKDTVPLDMLENDTRNQHFVTRVEQKLNAMNPRAGARNLRIYSFEVVDREKYILALESQNGRLIGSNLSLFDLFSFDVPGGSSLRLNFESLFQKYEADIEVHTKSLLAKLNAGSRAPPGTSMHPARYQRRAVCQMVAPAVHAAGTDGRGTTEFLRGDD
jgi:hypothetical protein